MEAFEKLMDVLILPILNYSPSPFMDPSPVFFLLSGAVLHWIGILLV